MSANTFNAKLTAGRSCEVDNRSPREMAEFYELRIKTLQDCIRELQAENASLREWREMREPALERIR